MRGHALECRITSESPFDGFLPVTGTVSEFEAPGGPGVRWDGGIARGSEIGLHYDPLLGKLIAWASDRAGAIRRMRRALRELRIDGVVTNAPLLMRIMEEGDFAAGRLSTAYLRDHPELFALETAHADDEAIASRRRASGARKARTPRRAPDPVGRLSAFPVAARNHSGRLSRRRNPAAGQPGGGTPVTAPKVRYIVEFAGCRREVTVGSDGQVTLNGAAREASLSGANPGGVRSLLLDGASFALAARRRRARGQWEIVLDGRALSVQVLEAREARILERAEEGGASAGIAPLRAPMPGLVVGTAVQPGDLVEPGAAMLIVEAMKMENELRATSAARVARILVSPGDAVKKGQVLVEFEEVAAP